MSRNNVRGPTSALTDFLKASGITPTTIARRAATRAAGQTDEQPVAGPSTTTSTAAAGGTSTSGRVARRTRSSRVSGYASDNLDEPEGGDAAGDVMDVDEEDEEKTVPAKKRKLTKAAEAKLKAKEKKKKDSDDDEDEDAYTALSKSLWSNKTSKPPVGSFEDCAVCKKQFTVTKYTLAANSGTGFLCHQCAKAGGIDPFKKLASPKKRKVPADRRNITNFEERRFPTLVSVCIKLITKHIDDIEALGDIGSLNVEAISKALSKNRGLTPENVHLFYDTGNSSLALFDATNLLSPALETLAYHNANLTSLRLDFCGHLDDTSFKVVNTSLPFLQRLELLGPFLVRPAAWQAFFKSHPKLEAFLITQSPRFNEACIESLVKNCPDIIDLRLKEIGHLNDFFLSQIRLLNGLRRLDLADPTESCTESVMIALMRSIGKSLTHLNVSKHDLLGDRFLSKGLQPHTKILQSLTVSHLPELTDDGVSKFFASWKNPSLVSLDLSRNEGLTNLSLESLVKHSGKHLEELNINGWKDVGEDALKLIGRLARDLKKLDVGWCRAVDDFLLKALFEGEVVRGVQKGGCEGLQEVKVWGCNKITHSCPRKKGTMILGVESHISH